jgi:hypothetical protein
VANIDLPVWTFTTVIWDTLEYHQVPPSTTEMLYIALFSSYLNRDAPSCTELHRVPPSYFIFNWYTSYLHQVPSSKSFFLIYLWFAPSIPRVYPEYTQSIPRVYPEFFQRFFRRNFRNFFNKFFRRIFYLLTIASFRIGVPSILLLIILCTELHRDAPSTTEFLYFSLIYFLLAPSTTE